MRTLSECATVEEVIAWIQAHRWHTAMRDQLHFADATGDAVVISAGPDGKVAFTRKPPGDSFLVSTNFNVANPSSGGYPCWRHSRAEEMLSRIESQDELTAERVASVMDAVHVESASGWTLNTLVADLPKRLVYVYTPGGCHGKRLRAPRPPTDSHCAGLDESFVGGFAGGHPTVDDLVRLCLRRFPALVGGRYPWRTCGRAVALRSPRLGDPPWVHHLVGAAV